MCRPRGDKTTRRWMDLPCVAPYEYFIRQQKIHPQNPTDFFFLSQRSSLINYSRATNPESATALKLSAVAVPRTDLCFRSSPRANHRRRRDCSRFWQARASFQAMGIVQPFSIASKKGCKRAVSMQRVAPTKATSDRCTSHSAAKYLRMSKFEV